MKCGHCKQDHATVAEVRACYGVSVDPGGVTGIIGNKYRPAQVKATWDKFEDIPAGHYATESLTGNNDLDFWRVDRPTEGQWAGYVFVKRVIGGKPDMPVRKAVKFKALEAIRKAVPEKAALLYAQELGRCSRCNRHLTDELSRQYGMGPECRSK